MRTDAALADILDAHTKEGELYERLAFGGLGNPSDLETIRQTAIDFCHAEGFQRSPEDVSIQRVVGFALSPVLKRGFADPLRGPLVLRELFAQVGAHATDDLFYTLNSDGALSLQSPYARPPRPAARCAPSRPPATSPFHLPRRLAYHAVAMRHLSH